MTTNRPRSARRLALNGLGGIQIRLGWEANGDWFPWTAVGKSAEEWKQCYTRVALAMKSTAPELSFCWSMGKKGRIDVRTIFPDEAPISAICLSHYDDPYDRFGYETHNGGPWGLRAWLDLARAKGVKLALGEWGVGRAGDNPQYIQDMHDFLVEAGDTIAYESYFNTGVYPLFPADQNQSRARSIRSCSSRTAYAAETGAGPSCSSCNVSLLAHKLSTNSRRSRMTGVGNLGPVAELMVYLAVAIAVSATMFAMLNWLF